MMQALDKYKFMHVNEHILILYNQKKKSDQKDTRDTGIRSR